MTAGLKMAGEGGVICSDERTVDYKRQEKIQGNQLDWMRHHIGLGTG